MSVGRSSRLAALHSHLSVYEDFGCLLLGLYVETLLLQVPITAAARTAKELEPLQAALPLAPMLAAPVAVLLQEQYWALEEAYMEGLASAFARVRIARERQLRHFAGQREAFSAYLRRPAPDKDEQV